MTRNAPKRRADPRAYLADPTALAERLAQLPGAPWDVFTGPEVADAIDPNLSPLTLNDWFYKGIRTAPPREPVYQWMGNTARYRKDRLIGWALTGRPLVPDQVWQMSADYLSEHLAMRRPWTLRDTETDILWLLDRGVITLRARPRFPFLPFTCTPAAEHPAWGFDPFWPSGVITPEMMIVPAK